MAIQPRFRIAAALGALIAPLALVATSSTTADAAAPKHKHELTIYKVEKYVKLGGMMTDTADDPSTAPSLSCDTGDIAVDGMWIIRSVDKKPNLGTNPDPDEDPGFPSDPIPWTGYNDARDVYVQASYPDSVDQRKWNFKFDNRAYGDAQLTIYAVCVDGWTQYTNGHRHAVTASNLLTGAPQLTVANSMGWLNRTVWDSSTLPVGGACAANQYFVAPGFDVSGSASDHRLVASYATNAGKSWAWQFGANNFDNVKFYGKCLDRQLTSPPGHKHTLAMSHQPSNNIPFSGHPASITPGGDWRDFSYACDQDKPLFHGYKAAVGMFYLGLGWEHAWFYGMEPRPKIRSFRFYNSHASQTSDVRYGTLCVNTRTSNQY